jgi:hypothetical protein
MIIQESVRSADYHSVITTAQLHCLLASCSDARLRMTAADLEPNPLGLVESRLLYTGFADAIRERCAARQVITLPVPETDSSALLVVGLATRSRR